MCVWIWGFADSCWLSFSTGGIRPNTTPALISRASKVRDVVHVRHNNRFHDLAFGQYKIEQHKRRAEGKWNERTTSFNLDSIWLRIMFHVIWRSLTTGSTTNTIFGI